MKVTYKNKLLRKYLAAAGCVLLLAGCAGKEAGEPVNPLPFGAPIEGWQEIEPEDGVDREDAAAGNSLEDAASESENGKDSEILDPSAIMAENGMTLETRVQTPAGYERKEAEEGSLAQFLRQYPVKEAGSRVHLYDGSEKWSQEAVAAVFDLPIENYDLQQCADSVMRIYAEYFWNTAQYDRIAFHFTNGFLAEYSKWREGQRIQVSGNDVKWVASKAYDDSYECFVQYLKMVFCYAGTLSMDREASPTTPEELKSGDVFLYGGSPGHVVLVVDVCENEAGQKAFLLGQGYMPAQEFHLLKNPQHEENPWYYQEEVTYPFVTPEYVFQGGSLKKLSY